MQYPQSNETTRLKKFPAIFQYGLHKFYCFINNSFRLKLDDLHSTNNQIKNGLLKWLMKEVQKIFTVKFLQ